MARTFADCSVPGLSRQVSKKTRDNQELGITTKQIRRTEVSRSRGPAAAVDMGFISNAPRSSLQAALETAGSDGGAS